MDSRLQQNYEEQLATTLRNLRATYEQQMAENRSGFSAVYDKKIADLTAKLVAERGSAASAFQVGTHCTRSFNNWSKYCTVLETFHAVVFRSLKFAVCLILSHLPHKI